MNTGPVDIQNGKKSFGLPEAPELPILNVAWDIVDNGTALLLLSWTTAIKEVMQTSVYVNQAKRGK